MKEREMTTIAGGNPYGVIRDEVLAHPLDLSVIIVTYNATRHIESCLHSIYQNSNDISFEVIVSDNQSTDGTVELVQEKFPQVKLLRGTNRGYGAGNNRGLAVSRGRYCVILNDDTIILDGSLTQLVHFMDQHPDVGMLGPKLLNVDGSLQPSITNFPRAWKDIVRLLLPRRYQVNTPGVRQAIERWSRLFPQRRLGRYDNHEQTKPVDGVKGACFVVRRAVLDRVGGFDENIFFHTEEQEWAYRITRAGWRVVFYPKPQIIHIGGATAGADDREVPGRRFIQKHKSNLYFFEKHCGSLYANQYRVGLGMALLLRLCSLTLLGAFGCTLKTRSQEYEAYRATLRLLWDEEFRSRNMMLEIMLDKQQVE